MSSHLEIRPYAPSELEVVVALWERSRRDAQPWLEERMAWSHASNLAHFRDVVARECDVWLAVEAGSIVGLLALGRDVIGHLYVDPPHQRRGVGTALLDFARERCAAGLTLFTHQRNERARAFYEASGFTAIAFGVSPAPESEPDVKYAWRPKG